MAVVQPVYKIVFGGNGAASAVAAELAADRAEAAADSISGLMPSDFVQAGVGAVPRSPQSKMRDQVSIFDFMSAALIADVQAGTLLLDCAAAFTAALAASKNIYFPPGKYRFNNTITLSGVRGLTLTGAASALMAGGTGYTGTTELYFSNGPSDTHGILITDFTGVRINNMSIVMRRGGTGAGYALFMHNGHDYVLENLKFDTAVNAGGGGLKLGNGNGATATFIGNLKNIKCIVDGAKNAGIYLDFGTSITAQGCYVIGGRFYVNGMAYCSIHGCAVDVSSGFAYIVQGSNNVVFSGCGAEQAEKAAFYLSTTSTNVRIDAPYGAANNQSGDASIGDLVFIDNSAGAVNSITITNPTSLLPNAATLHNISSNAGGGFVEVLNTDATLLSLGVGGNATWLREKVTITGHWDQFTAWTPTLAGWTNVGTPTVVGKYKRVGKTVTLYVKVAPATSISATKVTSTITGLPFGSIECGSATMADGNTNSYGVCTISPTGIIYPQTSGVITVPVEFVGTVILT